MNAVALKIKKLRANIGLTQEQMAEKVHLSVKAWQKIENGITKLDLDRLNQIAEILEISLIDLINSEEGIYVHQINDNTKDSIGSVYHQEVVYNHVIADSERELFNKIIADKDTEIEFLRGLVQNKNN